MSANSVIHWFAKNPEELLIYLESVGLTEIDLAKLRSPAPWGPVEDRNMCTLLREIIFGTARLSHYQDIDLPGQYVGKIIAEFVHPANHMVACHLFGRVYERAELQAQDIGVVTELAPMKPSRLFAFVSEWYGGDRIMLSEKLEKMLNVRQRNVSKVA